MRWGNRDKLVCERDKERKKLGGATAVLWSEEAEVVLCLCA